MRVQKATIQATIHEHKLKANAPESGNSKYKQALEAIIIRDDIFC